MRLCCTIWPINLGIIGMCVILFGQLTRCKLLFSLYDTGERWLHLLLKVGIIAFQPTTRIHWWFAATGFSAAFPWIRHHLLTLATNFQMPFYRDILLALGVCSVSKQSCSNILKGGPGSAITIVVGGAAESLSAHPGTADLTLRRRSGLGSLDALFSI